MVGITIAAPYCEAKIDGDDTNGKDIEMKSEERQQDPLQHVDLEAVEQDSAALGLDLMDVKKTNKGFAMTFDFA